MKIMINTSSIMNKYDISKISLPNLVVVGWVDSVKIKKIQDNEKLIKLTKYEKNTNETFGRGQTFKIEGSELIIVLRQTTQSVYGIVFYNFVDFYKTCVEASLSLGIEDPPIPVLYVSNDNELIYDKNLKKITHEWEEVQLFKLKDQRVFFKTSENGITLFNSMNDFNKYYNDLKDIENSLDDY